MIFKERNKVILKDNPKFKGKIISIYKPYAENKAEEPLVGVEWSHLGSNSCFWYYENALELDNNQG